MISDERVDKIDTIVQASLNEECAPAKVAVRQNVTIFFDLQRIQGGLGAVNARVYAVRVWVYDASHKRNTGLLDVGKPQSLVGRCTRDLQRERWRYL